MADTIETFVAKLHKEGVQAGQAEADKIRADAKAHAGKILAEAKAQAEKIVADAEARARSVQERTRTDLELAARDTLASLRESLSSGLKAIVAEGSRKSLEDAHFLGEVLHAIVMLYVQADLEKKPIVKINVSPAMLSKIEGWALHELGKEVAASDRPRIDLKGKLAQAGFEYEVEGGTVEVTLDSVVQTISELVTPRLREILAAGAARKN
jgi:vacuolar-type H+-ATPase subunit H